MTEFLNCPECGHLAEIEWRDRSTSTAGPVEHLKIRCVNRHWFLMLADQLPGATPSGRVTTYDAQKAA